MAAGGTGPRVRGWAGRADPWRRLATEEPRVDWQFVGGRRRDPSAPAGGAWGLAALFVVFGAGVGSLMGRYGFPVELIAGEAAGFLGGDALLGQYALAGLGAAAGFAAACGYAGMAVPERVARLRRLGWTFWMLALAAISLRMAGDLAAQRWLGAPRLLAPGWETSGVLLDLVVLAVAFLAGAGLYRALEVSRYDHDEFDGPIGLLADRERATRAAGWFVAGVMLMVSFAGLVAMF